MPRLVRKYVKNIEIYEQFPLLSMSKTKFKVLWNGTILTEIRCEVWAGHQGLVLPVSPILCFSGEIPRFSGKKSFSWRVCIQPFNKYSLSAAAAAAKSVQSCLTLCDPIDGSPPGSPVPGILQARVLEWVAISFSNAWKWKVKAKSLSRVQLFQTPWTVAFQALLPMGFSQQEYWSGVPSPSLH